MKMDTETLERIMREWPDRLEDTEIIIRIVRGVFHTEKKPRKTKDKSV